MNAIRRSGQLVLGSAVLMLSSATLSSAAPATDTKAIISQSVKVIEQLAIAARPHVTEANTRLQDLQTRAQQLNAVQQRLESDLQLARQSHTENENQLKSANSELYGAQTRGVALPAVAELHGRLLSQVPAFQDQALDPSSPRFLEGDIVLALRPAMARVVDSQDRYVARVGDTGDLASSFLQTVKSELLAVASNPNSALARFGTDHYLNLLLQRLDAQRTGLRNAATFFQGKTIEGSDELLTSDCPTFFFSTFSEDLALVRAAVSTLPYRSTLATDPSFLKTMNDEILPVYNGVPGNPGWISHWGSCIGSAANNIAVLTNDINREYQRNNIELARQLDIQRADLDYRRAIYLIERDIVIHRRDQLLAILSSVAAQTSATNLSQYPEAWRKTAYANIDNLDYVAAVFPRLIDASVDLLTRAEAELMTLQTVFDPVALAAEMRLVANKLDAIQLHGYALLREQFTSVHESLHVMSVGIASGERSLAEAIDVYNAATATKFDFWSQQLQELPVTISNAEADVAAATQAFQDSLAFLQDLEPRLDAFKTGRREFTTALNSLLSRIAAARFNPIYTGLMTLLLDNASLSPKVEKLRKPIEAAGRSFLGRFKGVDDGTAASSCGGKKKCPKVRITSAVAKTLQREAQLIRSDIRSAIDDVALNLIFEPLFDVIERLSGDLAVLENP